jgi:hypothetical protein
MAERPPTTAGNHAREKVFPPPAEASGSGMGEDGYPLVICVSYTGFQLRRGLDRQAQAVRELLTR